MGLSDGQQSGIKLKMNTEQVAPLMVEGADADFWKLG